MPYQVIGIVNGSDALRDMDDLFEELREAAGRIGADAVLISDSINLSGDFSDLPYSITGKAIKYKY